MESTLNRPLRIITGALAAALALAPLGASAQSTPSPAATAASDATAPASGAFAGWGLPPSCGDFLTFVPPPASTPAPWLAFLQTAQTIKDYTMTVHEVDTSVGPSPKSEDRMLKFAYKLPCYGRVSIESGRGAGGVAVWHGGHRVKGAQGGSMNMKAIIPDDDPRVTDLLGLPVYVLFIPYITSHLHAISSSITSAPGPTIAGKTTDAVTFAITNPAKNYGLAKVVVYLDSTTHFPLGNDGYDTANTLLLHSEMTNTVINSGLADDLFSLPN